MTRFSPWPLVTALCLSPLAEARERAAGDSGFRCLLANGHKFFALQDVSEHFPEAVHRCSPARVPTVWRRSEGKVPRILRDDPFVPDIQASASDPDPGIPEEEEAPLFARKLEAGGKRAAFHKLIVEASWRHELDPELVLAVIQVESAYRPHARSPKGALGLMQVMPATGARYGVSQPQRLLDPAINIDVGTRYLRDLHRLFKGKTELILAAYNAGEGAVARYGNRIPPYAETREYVRRALRIYRGHRP